MTRGVAGSGLRTKAAPVIELEWGDPPPDVPAAVAVYLEVLEDLRAKPDSWAQLATYPSSMGAVGAAKSLRLALANLDLGRFEFVTRRGGSGGALYGKYLGA